MSLRLKIYEFYYNFYNNKKKLNKYLFIGCLIHAGYFLIQTLVNELPFDLDQIFLPLVYYGLWLLAIKIFHKWFGQFWILKFQQWQTKEFQKYVMDKNIKAAGKRGGFKDTSQSGMASNFVVCSKETLQELMDDMTPHLYMFDLKAIKEYISCNLAIFNVASKKTKRENFLSALVGNELFLKGSYKKLENEILSDFRATRGKTAISHSKYIISDSINHQHIIAMLYEYMYYYWRLEIDVWIISNQPCFQYYDFKTKEYKMAKIFSPDLKSTKNRKVKVSQKNENGKTVNEEYITVDYMISEDWICFWESEADIWWNNIEPDVKKNIQERGIRWGEVIIRHTMGEHVMSLRNGQVAGRTAKIQRDLEESFYSVTRKVTVYGGEKRIFWIKLLMKLLHPIFLIRKDWKSKLTQKISQLKMSGWLKLETVFSRSEQINYQVPGVSLSQLLDRENPLYMSSYQTTLVFNIRDCWGKFNTHYLEYIAEGITDNSQATLMNLDEWNPDLRLREEHIISMNYDTVDLFNIPLDKKYTTNKRYKKVEKENKNAMRLD